MRSIPHACPVCKGRGEITDDLAQHEAVPKYTLGDHKIYACHVCMGSCMVWEYVDNNNEVEEEKPALPNVPIQLPWVPSPLVPQQPLPYKILDPNQGGIMWSPSYTCWPNINTNNDNKQTPS